MEDTQPLPAWALGAGILIPTLIAGLILFEVNLIGSWGVGDGPKHDAELLFREEFMLVLCFGGSLLVAFPLALLFLRDPEERWQRWAGTGAGAGLIVAILFLGYMTYTMLNPRLSLIDAWNALPSGLPLNVVPVCMLGAGAGAVMALVSRGVTHLLLRLR